MNDLSDKKFYTTTNWAPWLGIGILLSSFFFSIVSNPVMLVGLIFLSFLPSIVVALSLKTYFVVEDQQVNLYYDRPSDGYDTPEEALSVNIEDIDVIRKIGKSVILKLNSGEVFARRVKNADAFVQTLSDKRAAISVVTY